MKKLFITAGCFLFLCVGAIFFFCNSLAPEHTEKAAEIQKVETPVSQSYLIKEWEGNIAVFEEGNDTPFRTTTVALNELPPADRDLLTKGISAASQEELNTILEDYCS